MPNQKDEIEIEIDHTGKVTLHVVGTKGKKCVKKAQEIAQLIGRVEDQNLTSEYYQQDPSVGIIDNTRTKL